MNYLIVIDMQTGFIASDHVPTNLAIEREIKKAKRLNHKIVFVEFSSYGPTNQNLKDTLGSYKKFKRIVKWDTDGSDELIIGLKLNKDKEYKLKICGVYTDRCVWATYEGLHRGLPLAKFTIVGDGCFANEYDGDPDRISIFENCKRTKIVSRRKKKNLEKAA